MSHSHLVVNHLLRQAEEYRLRKAQQDVRPAWITALIDDIAELFEPLEGVARVGFDCRLEEDGWFLGLFLGVNEIVGGPLDGHSRMVDFQFDLLQVIDRFTQIDRCYWQAGSNAISKASSASVAAVTFEGRIGTEELRLRIYATAPEGAIGPALREYPNGQTEAV